MVEDTKKRLKELQVTGENEKIRNTLLENIKKYDVNNINYWIDSFKQVSILNLMGSQLLFVVLALLLVFTPLNWIGLLYFIMLPAIIAAQGELWEEGLGQYIRLHDRDILDTITRTLLLLASSIGVLFLTKEDSFNYCITILVLMLIFINKVVGNCIYQIIALFGMEEDSYEYRYVQIKYKSFYFFYPIVSSIIGISLGGLLLFGLSTFFDRSKGESVKSFVKNI